MLQVVQVVGSLHPSQCGSHGSHDVVMGSGAYPVLHDPQIWAPSVFVQAGAVRVHMHVRVVEQDVVEEVSVLKYRSPEEYFQHPRGEYEYDSTSAVVSEHPCAVAASSHSAWLPTHAPPLLSVHNPDVRASNPAGGVMAMPLVQVQVQAVVDVAMEPPPELVKVESIRPRLATQAPQSFWLKSWA